MKVTWLMASSNSSRAKLATDNGLAICGFRLAAIILAGVIFAFLIDLADFPFMFATFLSVSGILRGTAAAIAADEFWAHDLNRWDEAAALIILSVLVFWIGGLSGGTL